MKYFLRKMFFFGCFYDLYMKGTILGSLRVFCNSMIYVKFLFIKYWNRLIRKIVKFISINVICFDFRGVYIF